jgi:hypothetical protein
LSCKDTICEIRPCENLDYTGFLVEVGIRAGKDRDLVGAELKIADGVAARVGITAAAELGGDVVGREGIAHPHRFGGGKYPGVVGKRAGAQFLVDHAGVTGVEEGKRGQHQDDENCRRQD